MEKDIWKIITENLKPDMSIKNWTIDNGYFGDNITIQTVDNDYVQIRISNSTTEPTTFVRVPKEDFKYVYTNWNAYITGTIKRNELRDNCRTTRYVIDILKYLDELNLGDMR